MSGFQRRISQAKGKACVEALKAACLAREEARKGELWKRRPDSEAGARAGMVGSLNPF